MCTVWFVKWLMSSRENIRFDEKSISRAQILIPQNCNQVWILITEPNTKTILTINLVCNEVIYIYKWIFRKPLSKRFKNNRNNHSYFYIPMKKPLCKLESWNTTTNLVSCNDYFISKLFMRREETKLNLKHHLKLRV